MASQTRRVTGKLESSADAVVRDIIEGLFEGRYVHGQRLVESDLTDHYGVSRGSVREALNRLASEGLVTLSLHRGACIRSFSRREVSDLLVLVELMVGLAGRLAAKHIDEGRNRALFRTCMSQLVDLEQKPGTLALMRARKRFYEVLVQLGRNSELGRVLPGLQTHIVRAQFHAYYEEAGAERVRSYQRIAAAIESGNSTLAERACRRHIRHIARGVQCLPDSMFASDPQE